MSEPNDYLRVAFVGLSRKYHAGYITEQATLCGRRHPQWFSRSWEAVSVPYPSMCCKTCGRAAAGEKP